MPAARTATYAASESVSSQDAVQRVEELLTDLQLGDHDEAQRRVQRLLVQLSRSQQRAMVETILEVATASEEDLVHHLASSLLEAADRLDPRLILTDEVEMLALHEKVALRSSSAVLMWQRAEVDPGNVSIPLLGRLTRPGSEDWYVQAPARAAAKQLLLVRSAARAIFDRMVASRDRDVREYAATDLLEVATVEPCAVPADLAKRLAVDEDAAVAVLGETLQTAIATVETEKRRRYYGSFGL